MLFPTMPDPYNTMVLGIRSVGFMARRAMAEGGPFRVGAVFEKSFYIKSGEDWFCVVPESLGRGPLSLTCDAGDQVDWYAEGIHAGMFCQVNENLIDLGRKFLFALKGAETWMPPPPSAIRAKSVHQGLARLENAVAGRVPGDGLGCYVVPGGRGDRLARVAAAAAEYVHGLEAWLQAGMAAEEARVGEAPSLAGLIGLGPGLTPSGDDFIGGVLITLRSIGFAALADRLYAAVGAIPGQNLNPVSAAYLAAAAEGAGSERLHVLLETVAGGGGERLASELDAAVNMGHSSGWDALAGVTTTLRAWCATRP